MTQKKLHLTITTTTPTPARREAAHHHAWHETDRGWVLTIKTSTESMRIFHKTPGGVYYIRAGGWKTEKQTSLKTNDRDVAERYVREYLEQPRPHNESDMDAQPIYDDRVVARALPACPPHELTVLDGFCYYVGSEQWRANNKAATRVDNLSGIQIMTAILGPDTLIALLDRETLARYANMRMAGGVAYTDYRELSDGTLRRYPRRTGAVKIRSVILELTHLGAMIRWASETRCPNREHLLSERPIRGAWLRGMRDSATPRPMFSREDVNKLIATAWDTILAAESRGDTEAAVGMRRLMLGILVADVSAERIGAIRQLRRSDFRVVSVGGRREVQLNWRPVVVKQETARTTPFPEEDGTLALKLLGGIPVVGEGALFRKVTDSAPTDSKSMLRQLKALMVAAGVEVREQLGWHGIRALWATERRTGDLKAAKEAGGWADWESFLRYVRVDLEAMRASVAGPRVGLARPGVDEQTHDQVAEVLRLR